MFEQLRDRIHNVQQDLALSLRDFTIGPTTSNDQLGIPIPFDYDLDVNLDAGADVINYFQDRWTQIQARTKLNVQDAEIVEQKVQNIDCQINNLLDSCTKFNSNLDKITPEIEISIDEIEKELGRSFNLLNKLQEAIRQLDQETIESSFEQRKHESRKKLNEMVARRNEDLALYESQLLSKQEKREIQLQRERQSVFQQAFQEELKLYKEKGYISEPGKQGKIFRKEGAKLEDISFEMDEKEINELEKFLTD